MVSGGLIQCSKCGEIILFTEDQVEREGMRGFVYCPNDHEKLEVFRKMNDLK